jgi:hypothetical protein
MKKRIMFVVVYYLTLLVFFVGISQAASVTLAWDANTEPDLKDYVIYHGQAPGEYNKAYILSEHPEMWNPVCGTEYNPFKSECCEIIIPDLLDGNNYFAATALDDKKNESAYSEELLHVVEKTESDIMQQPKDFEKIVETP